MCEFCIQHGDGKKWYLQAKNYSQDLLSDARRRNFIRNFFADPEHLTRDMQRLDKLTKIELGYPGDFLNEILPTILPGVSRRSITLEEA